MTAVIKGHTYKMVSGDVLDSVTLQGAAAGKVAGQYRVRAACIIINAGAGGACVLNNAGQDIVTFTTTANALYTIAGSDPLELDDFTVTIAGAGAYVTVFATP